MQKRLTKSFNVAAHWPTYDPHGVKDWLIENIGESAEMRGSDGVNGVISLLVNDDGRWATIHSGGWQMYFFEDERDAVLFKLRFGEIIGKATW